MNKQHHWTHIVVGAGAAGAAVASRLSEDDSTDVLLLEAGPDYRDAELPSSFRGLDMREIWPWDKNPEFFWPGLMARHTSNQGLQTHWRGRGLGGSSVVNGMVAIRGVPQDYDLWAAEGCDGWSYDDVLPAFRRLEDDHDFPDAPYHGRGGPVPIHRAPVEGWGTVGLAMREAALALGHPWSDDLNAPGSTGVSPYAMNIRDGRRVTSSASYLEPARDRANLTIRGGAHADRVLFDGGGRRAVGIVTATGEEHRIVEGGEVVVSAGTCHSPAILMRSGIGPAAELHALGIEALEDLPVGHNVGDHPLGIVTFPLAPGFSEGADGRRMNVNLRYSSGVAEAGPNDMMAIAMNYGDHVEPTTGSILFWVNRVFSTGRVRLVSADPLVDPEIDLRLLDDERDRTRFEDGLDHALELAHHPAFAASLAGPPSAPAREELSQVVGSAMHISGSCRMGSPTDPRTVVDPDCRVLGVDQLRVIDHSVAPEVPRANTYLTALMIGEHAISRMR